MTFSRILIGFLAVTLIAFSCRKDYSDEDGKIPGLIESKWEFKESDQLYNGDMDSAYFQTVNAFSTLSMIGSKAGGQNGEIILQVLGENIGIGTYNSPSVFFQYSENGVVLFQTSPVQSSGFSITITEIDSVSVSGSFSGTVMDAQGNPHNITDGKFTVAMTDNPGPLPTGQLTVWAKEICFDGSSIELKVSDQTGYITDALASEPICGASGTASFTLPQGIYSVIAICSNDTIRYDVNITGNCTLLQVDFVHPPTFEDYLPLTQGSFWDYNDLSNSTYTQRITVNGEETLDGRLYTRMISTLGDTMYYRKDQNVYYEYRTLNFQEYVSDPPSIEMVILHDDYNAGQSWESPPTDIILSGIGVKIKLISTILRRDNMDYFNGTLYDDLIEVETEILFSSDNGNTYQSSGSAYKTIFSKGNGIVYYFDLDSTIEWGVNNISLNP